MLKPVKAPNTVQNKYSSHESKDKSAMDDLPGRKRQEVILNGQSLYLEWSAWCPWDSLKISRGMVPRASGVYEVAHEETRGAGEKRLDIGCASNLRLRLSLLVTEVPPDKKDYHSEGARLRKAIHEGKEDASKLWVSWAATEGFVNVEKYLFMQYVKHHCDWPGYCAEIDVNINLLVDVNRDLRYVFLDDD